MVATIVIVIPEMRARKIWMNQVDLMRLFSWSICMSPTLYPLGGADASFLFTLEEFGREVLFLLDTVEEVRSIDR